MTNGSNGSNGINETISNETNSQEIKTIVDPRTNQDYPISTILGKRDDKFYWMIGNSNLDTEQEAIDNFINYVNAIGVHELKANPKVLEVMNETCIDIVGDLPFREVISKMLFKTNINN